MDSTEEGFSCQPPAPAGGDGSKTLFTDDIDILDVVDFPCLVDDDTMEFLRSHGRILFLSRGPPGSGKGTVASRLHELYPGSRLYWADKMFLTPMAPPRTKKTLEQSHNLCQQKITEYMQQNEPVIINRNTNMTVWETSQYLKIAAKYGYTVIILDIDRNLILKPEVLAVTNSKGLDQRYMKNRLKQWEHVYPYAMGWSPRPRDAAYLLHRYKKLAAELINGDKSIGLKPVQWTQFFPFCVARVCWFGRDERDREYCHSELVRHAYGRSDTLCVFGYAVTRGCLFAMVDVGEKWALLGSVDKADGDVEAMTRQLSLSLGFQTWEEVGCTVDISKFAPMEGCTDEGNLCLGDKVILKDVPPSRITFMPLGLTDGTEYSYSKAVAAASELLSSRLQSWSESAMVGEKCVKSVSGIEVYGSAAPIDDACLLVVDRATVKLDVVFTGYYQPHTTSLGGRSSSGAQNTSSTRQPYNSGGRYRAFNRPR